MWSAFGAIWLAIWTAYVGVGPWLGLTMLWPVYALAILYFVFLRFRNNRTMSILFALTALTMGYSIAWGFFATTGFTPGFFRGRVLRRHAQLRRQGHRALPVVSDAFGSIWQIEFGRPTSVGSSAAALRLLP